MGPIKKKKNAPKSKARLRARGENNKRRRSSGIKVT
jgi:hypothetical protein